MPAVYTKRLIELKEKECKSAGHYILWGETKQCTYLFFNQKTVLIKCCVNCFVTRNSSLVFVTDGLFSCILLFLLCNYWSVCL